MNLIANARSEFIDFLEAPDDLEYNIGEYILDLGNRIDRTLALDLRCAKSNALPKLKGWAMMSCVAVLIKRKFFSHFRPWD